MMAKVLRCRHVGYDCEFVARAETEEELLKEAAAHLKAVHHVSEITEDHVQQARAQIRDE